LFLSLDKGACPELALSVSKERPFDRLRAGSFDHAPRQSFDRLRMRLGGRLRVLPETHIEGQGRRSREGVRRVGALLLLTSPPLRHILSSTKRETPHPSDQSEATARTVKDKLWGDRDNWQRQSRFYRIGLISVLVLLNLHIPLSVWDDLNGAAVSYWVVSKLE
jgi:hypothetical protein